MNDYSSFQNRFSGFGIPGIPGMRTAQQAFQMATSARYGQFHQMKAQMPSDVLELFKANEIVFLTIPKKKKCRPLDPISNLGINIIDKFEIPNLQLMEQQKRQTKDQRKDRIALQRAQHHQNVIKQQMAEWNPYQDQKIVSDPQKTLVVARLDHSTAQNDLQYQFEKYGIIKSVRIIRDLNDQSKGYGFIEFDSKNDFITAYKQGNHRKIHNRKVTVDYQKGRTLLKWKPRRFGGGQGGQSRMTKSQLEKKQKLQKLKQQKKRAKDRDRPIKTENKKQRKSPSRQPLKKEKQMQRQRSYRKQQKQRPQRRQRQRQRDVDRDVKRQKLNNSKSYRERQRERSRQRDYYEHRERQRDYQQLNQPHHNSHKQKKDKKDKKDRDRRQNNYHSYNDY